MVRTGLNCKAPNSINPHPPHSYTHTHTHTHYQLTATETMNYDDAFTLEKVTEQLVDKFNHVAGIVPVLTAHIKQVGVVNAGQRLNIQTY